MPDVVAWSGSGDLANAIFVECKAPKESFLAAQEDWVWAALRVGVEADQIGVAVRPF